MAEFKAPTTEKEVEAQFDQIKPDMNATMAHYESSRCLFCFDAPCVQACPTSIDIPLFIRQINTANVKGAAKTIFSSNYFANTCGKVCPTEVLCEGACVYNHQDVKPIEIGRLQSFASQLAIDQDITLFKPAPTTGKKVAIIGAGPAGISAACELRLHGHEVTIFEAKTQPSGLALHGCAPYKVTNKEVLEEMAYLEKQFGYKVVYNSPIGKTDLEKLEKDYDAVFLGIGLGDTREVKIPNEKIQGCHGATEFIEKVKLEPLKAPVGNRVVVIGGGNTAMDAASESARLGAGLVILAYRRKKEDMAAYEFEYDLAKGAGVKGMFNVNPVEVLGTDKVTGIKLIQTKEVNGKLENVAGSEFDLPCDMVVFATGQEKQKSFLSMIPGLELDGKGRIKTNEHFQTTNPKFFASGDAVNGGAEVVNACGEAKKAAQGMHAFLTS